MTPIFCFILMSASSSWLACSSSLNFRSVWSPVYSSLSRRLASVSASI